MDPVTQGFLGAAATQALLGRQLGPRAWLYGALGGMAADLDVLITSPGDPLLSLRFHRHFTHSLSFIPIGGLISGLPLLAAPANRKRWKLVVAGTTIGYATHALLDAFTSYGTQLWWPLSSVRVAWNWISIVDPIYTVALAIGVVMAARRNDPKWARWGLLVASLYLCVCGVQRLRALAGARALATLRGDEVSRLDAFPMLPANVVWRTAYETPAGELVFDEARTPWLGATKTRPGTRARRIRLSDLPEATREDPGARQAFETFEWFASGWIAPAPDSPWEIGDLRYSTTVAGNKPMWRIRLRPGEQPPVERANARSFMDAGRRWRNLLYGEPDE